MSELNLTALGSSTPATPKGPLTLHEMDVTITGTTAEILFKPHLTCTISFKTYSNLVSLMHSLSPPFYRPGD